MKHQRLLTALVLGAGLAPVGPGLQAQESRTQDLSRKHDQPRTHDQQETTHLLAQAPRAQGPKRGAPKRVGGNRRGQNPGVGEKGKRPFGPPRLNREKLEELGDAELYFEAYYRRSFRFDFQGAIVALQVLVARPDSPYQRLGTVRLIEAYRDAMRYPELCTTLTKLRDDRENELSGVMRTRIRTWVRYIEDHRESVEIALRTHKRKMLSSGQKLSEADLEGARRELSIQLMRSSRRKMLLLDSGSTYFARALGGYAGTNGKPDPLRREEMRKLERQIADLESRGEGESEESMRLQAKLQGLRSLESPQSEDSAAMHQAMVHNLLQKRKNRADAGQKAIVRLLDRRIAGHLRKIVEIGVDSLKQASDAQRRAILREFGHRMSRLRGSLQRRRAGKEELRTFDRLQTEIARLVQSGQWNGLERRLRSAIDDDPELLREILLVWR